MSNSTRKSLKDEISRIEQRIARNTCNLKSINRKMSNCSTEEFAQLNITKQILEDAIFEDQTKLNIIERDCLASTGGVSRDSTIAHAPIPMSLVHKAGVKSREEYRERRLALLNSKIPKEFYPEGYDMNRPYNVSTLVGIDPFGGLTSGTGYWKEQIKPAVSDTISHLGNRKL